MADILMDLMGIMEDVATIVADATTVAATIMPQSKG